MHKIRYNVLRRFVASMFHRLQNLLTVSDSDCVSYLSY